MWELDSKQREIHDNWNTKHKKVCPLCQDMFSTGAIGGRLTYQFTPTGLGDVIVVLCACGEQLSLTENDSW